MVAIVYLVAGISSRFGGKIKQFASIGHNGETLIEYSLNQALKSDFDKIIFIVGNLTELPFKQLFGDNYKGRPVYYALQTYDIILRDRPWGTGDAIMSIKEYIDSSFVICNGDDIYGENSYKILFDHLNSNKFESATIGYYLKDTLSKVGTVNRGIYQLDDNYVNEINETLNIDRNHILNNEKTLCSMNMFGFHKNVLDLMGQSINSFKLNHINDRKIECYLPFELTKLIRNNNIKIKLYPTTEKWYGITYPSDVEEIKRLLE